MRVTLLTGHDYIELVDVWEPIVTHIQLEPRDLRRLMGDAATVSRVRALLAGRSATATVSRLTDEQVFDEVIRRIGLGEFRLLKVEGAPYPFAPVQKVQKKAAKKRAVKKKAAKKKKAAVPDNVPPESKQCSSEGCEKAFDNAANNGTPLVEADAEGC